jgi:hypothetical protein
VSLPQEAKIEEKNPAQPKGIVDADAIPSLVIEPLIPTVMEDKDPSPATKKYHIDPQHMTKYKNSMQQPSMEIVQLTNEEAEE